MQVSSPTTSTSNTHFPFSPNFPKDPPKTRLFPIKTLQSSSASHLSLLPYTTTSPNDVLVRRPVIPPPEMKEADDDDDGGGEEEKKTPLDESLESFAKKMPMFEPSKADQVGQVKVKPLKINLDLALYRAKILTQKFQFDEAEKILQQCIYFWPEDGRAYVALAKVLRKQSRQAEARSVYEKGSQATQGENSFIWQCWAVLESDMGNVKKARELFDAATVADRGHVAAWHGWAVLEMKQGNVKKAKNLLSKAIKYCGGNEYVYQTLAVLEAKANRNERARYLFRRATRCNPKSCASWLAWAQLEMREENNRAAQYLFERAVKASPKNRFAWHVWGLFEAKLDRIDKARKLLKIGHLVNPRDPVLLQSLALIEYKYTSADDSRELFRRAAMLDPKHQPVWMAWGWMEWKEGNLEIARELYQKTLSIDTASETASRCLQAWGVLEQRAGNLPAARRLLKTSLNVNSQSYVTWMTWAKLEEDQGNAERAEEIRELYFQQRIDVVDDASWVMGLFDVIDPAVDSIKKLLRLKQDPDSENDEEEAEEIQESPEDKQVEGLVGLDLDAFIKEKLSLDPSKLDERMEISLKYIAQNSSGARKVQNSRQRVP